MRRQLLCPRSLDRHDLRDSSPLTLQHCSMLCEEWLHRKEEKKEQKKIFTVLSVFESVFRDLLLREASTDIYAVVVEDFMGGACPRSFHSGVQTVQKARYGKVEGMEGIDENGDGERFQLTEIFDEHASKYRCTRAKGDVAHFSKFRSRSPAFERYTRGARSSVPQTG